MLQILNLHYFHRFFTAFYAEIDDLVRNVIVSRMPLVVEQGASQPLGYQPKSTDGWQSFLAS